MQLTQLIEDLTVISESDNRYLKPLCIYSKSSVWSITNSGTNL